MINQTGLHAVLLAALLTVGTHPASATDDSTRSTARALAQDAERDFKAGRFAAASQKFQKAYEAVRVPTLARSAARAMVEQGNLVQAAELYNQAIRLEPNDAWTGKTQQAAQEKSRDELSALEPRIPKITISIEGAVAAEVEVLVDDVRVPTSLIGVEQRVNPGTRHVVGRRGNEVVEQTVALKERETKPVALVFTAPVSPEGAAPASLEPLPSAAADRPTPSAAPGTRPVASQTSSSSSRNTYRTLGWVSVGVGAAGLVFGTATGIVTGVKYGSLEDECPNNRCVGRAAYADRVDSYSRMRTLSTVGFVVGGIGAAAGVTLLLVSAKSESGPAVGLWVTPRMAGLQGAF